MEINQTISIETSIEIYKRSGEINFYIYLKERLIGRIDIELDYKDIKEFYINGATLGNSIHSDSYFVENYELFFHKEYIWLFEKLLEDKDEIYQDKFEDTYGYDESDENKFIFEIFFEHIEKLTEKILKQSK